MQAERSHVMFEIDGPIALITLNRPERANAQSPRILRDLDTAWEAAEGDRDVRVIVLKSTGRHFSAGHDLKEISDEGTRDGRVTLDLYYDWEQRGYLYYAKKWRSIPKPSIAAVQGKCIAAGLMLCWPCDLIVAADDAEFSDPVLRMGIMGVEFHAHAWEWGARKAKELLFTGRALSATEAADCGMVNRVVPRDELVPATLELARDIAAMDPWAVRMAKRAVNHSLDVMGFTTAIDACFDIHHLGHARAIAETNGRADVLADLSSMRVQNAQTKRGSRGMGTSSR